jgi:LysM repeat protein
MSDDDFTCGPDDASAGACDPPTDPSQYTVQDGDTWESIATAKSVDPANLMLVNGVDPTEG